MMVRSTHVLSLALLVFAMVAAACQGSVTNVVGPGGTKCAISLQANASSFDAAGGQGTVTVTAAAECTWRASTDASWITLTSSAGQGSGVIQFSASGNPGSSVRRAAVIVADTRVELSQAGVPCQISLTPASESFGADPGEGTVAVGAPLGCQWSASSSVSWVSIVGSASGAGSGTVRYRVEANSGATRDATLRIANETFGVNQRGTATACSISLGSSSRSLPASGGEDVIAVGSEGPCPWAATSSASWITIVAGAAGNGSGTVRLRIAANAGAPRVGLVTVTGHTYVVSQEAATVACSYSISAPGQTVPVEGGAATVMVLSQPGCGWTAPSHASWITVASAAGSSAGPVALLISPNTGAQRVGQLTIAGFTHRVTQAGVPEGTGGSGGDGSDGDSGGDDDEGGATCSYSIAPQTQSVGSAGGQVTIAVSTGSACGWTSRSNAGWISILNGASGSGAGAVQLIVAPNGGSQRIGTVTVAGLTHTITQAAGVIPCSFALASSVYSSPAAGGATNVSVTATSGCQWTAESHAAWITIADGGVGSGSGSVQLSLGVNTGAERVGTVTVAGHTFTVTQAAADQPCTYQLNPTTQTVSLLGGEFSVTITTQSGCAWTATTEDAWITFTTSAEGVGSGSVRYRIPTVSLGLLFSREGSIMVGGQTLTVQQKGVLVNGS